MKKVFVGLSGGVDSSVSALLLKQQGYEVTGVFIRGWQPDWIPCTWKTDRISAMRTAAHLEIPFITLDLERQYKDKVVTYLLSEYEKGNTPNPDMLCNKEIKFGSFLDWAVRNGADYVATGHYTKLIGTNMHEGADEDKDQSYFLSQLIPAQLSRIIFPLGDFQKSQVRRIAAENNLPVATRKDSQGICFVGDLEMKDFLKKELNPKEGDVFSSAGEVIGKHEGAILYTIGERHGFTIFSNSESQKHMYVISKDLKENTITIGTKIIHINEEDNIEQDVEIKNFSFTNSLDDLANAKELQIRIRYRGEKYDCEFMEYDKKKDVLKIKSKEKLEFAHGQFAVLYDGSKCLGGGEL